ncbi:hypothetical protein JKF63_03316 [Porcisia hertigi]|uniref:Uncharacterized protein n=1 Tax=Porcisia hertigi TaxID=2761500 RepID=A0A836L977_9TRYP|nr:hypothetical protein JKF63_03316 [Porcisia hertigi]
MTSGLQFDVQVKGCAAVAFIIEVWRSHLNDAMCMLLETDQQLRQVRKAYSRLGIRSVVPAPPVASAKAFTRSLPQAHAVDVESQAMNGVPMLLRELPGGTPPLAAQDSIGTLKVAWGLSPISRVFTPVLTIPCLAHPMASERPRSDLETNASNFVEAWQQEDSKRTLQQDLIHDCLAARYEIEVVEERSRHRLQWLLLSASEQLLRFLVLAKYHKFVRFCSDQEPLWRQAALQLQKKNAARLDTTENVYARFLMEEVVLVEKKRMFQEAADFLVSQWFARREKCRMLRMSRTQPFRCRQQDTEVRFERLEPFGRTHYHTRHEGTSAAREGGSALPRVQRSRGSLACRCTGDSNERVSPIVEPLSALEVSPHQERRGATTRSFTNSARGEGVPCSKALPAASSKGHYAKDKSMFPSLPKVQQHFVKASARTSQSEKALHAPQSHTAAFEGKETATARSKRA